MVHSYTNRDNFFISIPDKSSKDTIFFIKSAKHLTVDDVISQVMKGEGKGVPMPKHDLFEMPVI